MKCTAQGLVSHPARVSSRGLGSVRNIRAKPVTRSSKAAQSRRVREASLTRAAATVEEAQQADASASSKSFSAGASVPDISKTVLGIILGGGAGTRLYPLTKKRAKPAVPLGANYRLIDIPVSNCINSGVNKIYCLTQFNSASLNRHLSQAYNSNVGGYLDKGFVEVLAAQQSPQNPNWFQGTADAVRQYMWLFEEAMASGVKDLLILSGDHLYRMNYQEFVAAHRAADAAITVAALPCAEKQAQAFGLMKIDETGRIVEFAEKPKGEALQAMRIDTTVLGLDAERAKEMPFLASMGIYVMKADLLKELLGKTPDANDFGSEIIPYAKDAGAKVQAFLFDGYWEDIGTIEAFYNSNLALTDPNKPRFSFYDREAPIYTMSRFLPPSKVLDAEVHNSIVGDGCVVRASAKITHSVIGLRTLISENVVVEDSLIMGADYYETVEECQLVPGCLPMGIGPNSVVRKAIVDKNARIGSNCQIVNKDNVQEANCEDKGYIIKDGIVVICKDAVIPDGTVI
eukprot:CAMPEP_0177598000 /NCGR_PEP_ID=MMETSP0419_2-20121207/12059_1 /TAXON_ID=582737 /ORGANISM="Tetraselmis sp., Strain GSL018" /LENGTH=514 /DNA_ID=CAMNT_0019090303 /DNA_START=182 /DNA_END=1726 /DNA_ORIENTATION=+